ncbi:MAG: xanthine phosphoribosyltransferase [Clostridia bacterium]|nr:xanthine phosphoribosyltransferase [Clostridia bacterium]MBQ8398889.1 xanthine phosphoribosyltransferase [Clostridia bacterium]
MKALEEKILTCGTVAEGNVLKVNSFLNHQLDVAFLCEVGKEFYRLFKDDGVTKILTIEASGIGVSCLTAQYFGCNVVFAKKSKSSNISNDLYKAKSFSYTHGTENDVIVSKVFLNPGDRVLIIDDFLAHGSALAALIDLVEQAGATVVGAGIVIEKAYQQGGEEIRARGYRVESLARIASMSVEEGVRFV